MGGVGYFPVFFQKNQLSGQQSGLNGIWNNGGQRSLFNNFNNQN